MAKGTITQYQIKELNDDVCGLKSDLKLVLENHLPHLKLDIINLDKKMTTNLSEMGMTIRAQVSELNGRVVVLTAVNIGAVILSVILARIWRI